MSEVRSDHLTVENDRVKGMICGIYLGDSLGVPHEFSYSNFIFTGKLEHQMIFRRNYGHPELKFAIGQASDDSEMSACLMNTIIENNLKYIPSKAIINYMVWANSTSLIGKNTRKLFKNIKTLTGFISRYKKTFEFDITSVLGNDLTKTITFSDFSKLNRTEKMESAQSNGSLMRNASLACLFDTSVVITDCLLTNPSLVAVDCCLVHVTMVRLALFGYPREDIWNYIIQPGIIKTDIVKEALIQAVNKTTRDMGKPSKGWVVHGIYVVFYVLYHNLTFEEAMTWIMSHTGSDTDTLACIAGSFLGALSGYEQLISNEITRDNINIMLKADLSNPEQTDIVRPDKYTFKHCLGLVDRLVEASI